MWNLEPESTAYQPLPMMPAEHAPSGRASRDSSRSPFAGLTRLHLIMGWQCNVRCSMCYQTDFSPAFNMRAEIYAHRLLDAYPHVTRVKLQGGEPTIMRNCRDAAQLLRGYPRVKVQLATNGVRVDDFWHETFVEQADFVSFSLNAATRQTYDRIVRYGNFADVVKNVGRLTAARRRRSPAVGVTAVILAHNLLELHQIVLLASELGADYVEFLVDPILSYADLPARASVTAELERCREAATRTGLPTEGLDGFRRRFEPDLAVVTPAPAVGPTCPAPFTTLVIDPDGTARVCCKTWVKIGNVTTSSLSDVWHSRTARRFRTLMNAGNYRWCSPDCSDNAHPCRLALLHKYWYQSRHDPEMCWRKARHKIRQLRTRDARANRLTFRRAT